MGLPEQLKTARKAMGYTQQQVAAALGLTTSTYCGYETGKRRPDLNKLKQLAQILNTTSSFLLEMDGPQANESPKKAEPGTTHQREPVQTGVLDSEMADVKTVESDALDSVMPDSYKRLNEGFKKVVDDLISGLLELQENAENP